MNHVFVVQHEIEDPDGYDEVKFIGVYATRERARQAVRRLKVLPGFCDYPHGFYIEKYELDKDHWTEGFGFGGRET